ncbi:MAG: glycosyltransferase [Eubacteriales bacterium]
MITISLCMIVKNEEEVLGRCLDSIVDIVDEIIIVDTGSTDSTKEIAEEYGAKIYDFQWVDDFSAARNYAFSKGTKEYLFWLDADDVILEEDRKKLKRVKEKMPKNIDVLMMKYNTGIKDDGEVMMTFYRERLIKRDKNFKWVEPVHEYVNFSGKVVNSDICITHKKNKKRSERNLRILEEYINNHKEGELKARDFFYYARELYHLGYEEEAILNYERFFEIGLNHSSFYIDACIDLYKCYMNKGYEKKAIRTLYRSFEYGLPRAEICCVLGSHYKNRKEYDKAIFWYELALRLKKPDNWGFVLHDCYGFVPCIQLSLLYSIKHKFNKAKEYNERAKKYKANHPAVVKNTTLLEKISKKLEKT